MIGDRGSVVLYVASCAIVFLCLINGAEARLSGVYGDNGHDQTIIHHTLTHTDQREVEHEILELLGLPERPRRNIHPSIRYVRDLIYILLSIRYLPPSIYISIAHVRSDNKCIIITYHTLNVQVHKYVCK